MDKNEIGLNAGKVWQLLSNNDKWSYGNLKKKSGLKDKDLGAALVGWPEKIRLSLNRKRKNSMFTFV